ncbi:hypothetical protein [Hymenobacter setariae]|uniref:hypothetical protein n=1 Tax=Hymenobacter setariae TaxID=2594794 RepID=UPI001F35A079|nr:hypothetical protein [Hymenobacter setariae]
MKTFLLFGALIWFLYSSWAPAWGPTLAIWLLIIGAFMVLGPSVAKLNRSERRNHYDSY